jgi:hypothetical protein
LSSFTVQRSRNGAAEVAYTSPTITEIDATNMPGVYSLLIDEDTTIASTSDSEEYCVHITHAGMAPVTRTIELYRRDTTSGQTITVANGAADADIERLQGSVIATPTVAGVLEVDLTHWLGTAAATPTVAGVPEVDLTHIAGAAVSTATAQLGVNVVQVSGSGPAADNAEIVFATDFATNYDTTLDRWQVDVDTWLGATAQGASGRPQVDLELWLGVAPNALVAGRVDTTVGAMQADTVTASAMAASSIDASALANDAVAEIADAVWDEDATGHQTQGTFGQAIGDPVADTNTIYKAVVTDATGATVGVDGAAILADTNELQTDWADGGRLDIILDARASQTSVDDLPTNAELATSQAAADDATLAAIAALNNLSAAQVNAEVLDVLTVDTFAQPGQESPAATATLKNMLAYLYKAWRNRHTQTATEYALFADDGTTKDQEAAVSDDGTTFVRDEVSTGA